MKENLKLLKLSKENQKKILGGTTRGSGCTPNETCVAAFDGYIVGYLKRK